MIITVTLNPAIDKTIEVKRFQSGDLNQVLLSRQDPGGKGINVSRVITSLGGESIATGFFAGASGEIIEKSLNGQGIKTNCIWVKGDTRTNLKIYDQSKQEITEINESGPEVTTGDVELLKAWLISHVAADDIVVLSGSVPKSLDSSIYAVLIGIVKKNGAKVFFDADGQPFKFGLEAKPQFIKPNRNELEKFFNQPIYSDLDLEKAAMYFIENGIERVFITLGSAGAYYRDKMCAYRLLPLDVEAHSSVGAGDAFVAACVYAMVNKLSTVEMLKLAVSTSAGAVETKGTNPAPLENVLEKIERVKLVPIKTNEGDEKC